MQSRIKHSILKFRKERGFNTRQLAEKAGCTPSFISQIEKGIAVPSLTMIGRLAAALNTSVSELLAEESGKDQNNWYLRECDRKTINYPDGKISSQVLTTRVTNKKMEVLISLIQPGGISGEAEKMTHPIGTEEFVLVLKGKIVFKINGKEFFLSKGDTLYFSGELPHSWRNRSKGKAQVLFVFNPPIW